MAAMQEKLNVLEEGQINNEKMAELTDRVSELEQGLTNIAQNIQGFAEDVNADGGGYGGEEGEEEDSYEPAPKPTPEELAEKQQLLLEQAQKEQAERTAIAAAHEREIAEVSPVDGCC